MSGTNGDARSAAAAAWQEAAAAGIPLSGAALGERFGRSPRWGRDVIASCRAAAGPAPAAAVVPHRQEVGDGQARRSWADTAIVLVVALVAACASFGHMAHVAELAGEPLWLARAFPITVDGLALAALRRGDTGRRWLVLALAVSVAANVLAQFPEHAEAAGPVVSAWPPLALYGTHRLLHRADDR